MDEREAAFHFEKLSREVGDGPSAKECVLNMDETNFVIDSDDGRTLALKSDESFKFIDAVRKDEEITMMVMLGVFFACTWRLR